MPALAYSVSLKSIDVIFGGHFGTGSVTLLGAEYEGFAIDFLDNTVSVRTLVADDLIGNEAQGFALEFVSNTSSVRT
jgi:hypothetical protein